MRDVPIIPMGEDPGGDAAAGQSTPRPWQTARRLSSAGGGAGAGRLADAAERFLAEAGFDRAPWLAVVFAGGILTWFVLPEMWQWIAAMAGGAGLAAVAFAGLLVMIMRSDEVRGILTDLVRRALSVE